MTESVRNGFGHFRKVSEQIGYSGRFRSVRNIPWNILEGSGVEARRGTMGIGPHGPHQASRPRRKGEGWLNPPPSRIGVGVRFGLHSLWRLRGEGSPFQDSPFPSRLRWGGVLPGLQLPPLRRIGEEESNVDSTYEADLERRSPNWTPES